MSETQATATSYTDLLAQKAELEAQIAARRNDERKSAIAQIRELMSLHELTAEDIAVKVKEVKKVEPKYRNPETGDTWTGRGKTPAWLKDKNAEDFLIEKA